MPQPYDAIIIGSGPNGLSAAIKLQQQGLRTALFELADKTGGSLRTRELTLPGFQHDIGATIMPLGVASPFLSTLPLEQFGLEWIYPEIPFAHPFPDGTALAAYQDVQKTARQMGKDESMYQKLFSSLVQDWDKIAPDLLGPLSFPAHPLKLASFGLKALLPVKNFANLYFKEEKTKALFYGVAAHSTLRMGSLASASFGLVLLGLAHKVGWPFPKGGAGRVAEALTQYYQSLGGEVHLNTEVKAISQLPKSKAYLFDLTPKQLLNIEGTGFTKLYRKRMSNYRYGAGVFKIDWALSKPIPFANELCRKAGTIHLGYSAEEITRSEDLIYNGMVSREPYVIVAQHTPFDNTRAPEGQHTAWGYCHVPHGSTTDYTKTIEDHIEKVAPGFKDTILARATHNTRELETFNPNLVGGDINGGVQDLGQLFTRPIARISPYSTPDERVYICSSSTPPGGGVHGMGGFHAAQKVIRDHFS